MVFTPSAIQKPSIAIVGAGRVGSTLALALHAAGYPITAVWSRTRPHADELAMRVGAVVWPMEETLGAATLTLVAAPDDRLAEVATSLANAVEAGQMVVHCSGVLPAGVLSPLAEHGALIGGFHPLAAIAERGQKLPRGVSFAVEAAEPLRGILRRMATDVGGHPFDLDPAARPLYHAAAVLASNYTVVLAALASDLLEQAGMERDGALQALAPLLRSALDNLEREGLPRALTGPLVRGDVGTVMAHLQALERRAPQTAQVYRVLAQAALPLVIARGNHDVTTIEQLEAAVEMETEWKQLCA